MALTKISLAEQARSELLDRIVKGILPTGARLTEETLCSEFQISRTPVRDALAKLEADGLIERLAPRGYQVRKLNVDAVDELLHCRMEVELHILRQYYTALDMDYLRELHSDLQNIDPHLPDALELMRKLDDDLHRAVSDACTNRYWQEIHQRLLKQRLPYRDFRNHGSAELAEKLKQERLELLAEILSGSLDQAMTALYKHLDSGRKDVLRSMTAAGQAD